jgi:hypothetical protein
MTTRLAPLRTPVDIAGGRASREAFLSQDVCDQEQEVVFGRPWLLHPSGGAVTLSPTCRTLYQHIERTNRETAS